MRRYVITKTDFEKICLDREPYNKGKHRCLKAGNSESKLCEEAAECPAIKTELWRKRSLNETSYIGIGGNR
jgi:hypothetical protein